MIVIVSATRIHPANPVRPFGSVLSLPDRNALFHSVDRQLAGTKGFTAVGRARRADDSRVADRELAGAMVDGDPYA